MAVPHDDALGLVFAQGHDAARAHADDGSNLGELAAGELHGCGWFWSGDCSSGATRGPEVGG